MQQRIGRRKKKTKMRKRRLYMNEEENKQKNDMHVTLAHIHGKDTWNAYIKLFQVGKMAANMLCFVMRKANGWLTRTHHQISYFELLIH